MTKLCATSLAGNLRVGTAIRIGTESNREIGQVQGLYYTDGVLSRVFIRYNKPPYFTAFQVVEDDDPRLQNEGTYRIKGVLSALGTL